MPVQRFGDERNKQDRRGGDDLIKAHGQSFFQQTYKADRKNTDSKE